MLPKTLNASSLVKTCFLTSVFTWKRLSFTFQTHNSNLLDPQFFKYITHWKMQHFCTIFQLTRCIQESFLMLFLWSARLVKIGYFSFFINLQKWYSNILHIEKCNIFVLFSNSPDASEKVDLMLFLWSARLVKIYSLTSSIKTYNFWHFSMFHKLQEHPSELYNLHFLHQHQNLYIFIWPILIQINSFLTPFHFCQIPAWCKSTQRPVLTKLRAFQSCSKA